MLINLFPASTVTICCSVTNKSEPVWMFLVFSVPNDEIFPLKIQSTVQTVPNMFMREVHKQQLSHPKDVNDLMVENRKKKKKLLTHWNIEKPPTMLWTISLVVGFIVGKHLLWGVLVLCQDEFGGNETLVVMGHRHFPGRVPKAAKLYQLQGKTHQCHPWSVWDNSSNIWKILKFAQH